MPLIYVDFEVRKDYIRQVLCIKRDQPIAVCHGRCYLTDQLEKAAETEKRNQKVNPVEIVFFFQNMVGTLPAQAHHDLIAVAHPALDEQKHTNPTIKGIFHPPRS